MSGRWNIKQNKWEQRIKAIGKWRFILIIAPLFFSVVAGTLSVIIFLSMTYFFNPKAYYFYSTNLEHILLQYILNFIAGILIGFYFWRAIEKRHFKQPKPSLS